MGISNDILTKIIADDNHCPFCGNDVVDDGECIKLTDTQGRIQKRCPACEKQWREMVQITPIRVEDVPQVAGEALDFSLHFQAHTTKIQINDKSIELECTPDGLWLSVSKTGSPCTRSLFIFWTDLLVD